MRCGVFIATISIVRTQQLLLFVEYQEERSMEKTNGTMFGRRQDIMHGN